MEKRRRSITYKTIKEFNQSDLQELFLSVEWSSGHYPDKLAAAMKNYATVYTACDDDKLVGLISAMDDGVMTVYVYYLLVNPAYQHQGIGKQLVSMVKEKYKEYLRIVVVAYNAELNFYNSLYSRRWLWRANMRRM